MKTTASGFANFDAALDRLAAAPGVLAALVAGSDGLPLAARMTAGAEDGESWAAVAAALGSLADRLCGALGRGGFASALFRAERRQFVVKPLSVGFLVVIAQEEPPWPDVQAAARELACAAQDLIGISER